MSVPLLHALLSQKWTVKVYIKTDGTGGLNPISALQRTSRIASLITTLGSAPPGA